MDMIPSRVSAALLQTRPWVRMFSVLFMLMGSLVVLFGIGMIIFGTLGSAFAGVAGLPGLCMGLIYLLMAFLYIVPGWRLWQYASGISTLLVTEDPADLADALEHQRGFWRFTGIFVAIMLVVHVILILFAVVIGGAGMLGAIKAAAS